MEWREQKRQSLTGSTAVLVQGAQAAKKHHSWLIKKIKDKLVRWEPPLPQSKAACSPVTLPCMGLVAILACRHQPCLEHALLCGALLLSGGNPAALIVHVRHICEDP